MLGEFDRPADDEQSIREQRLALFFYNLLFFRQYFLGKRTFPPRAG